MADSRVALVIDGREWYGWTGVQVVRSIEQIAGTFDLGLTEEWPGAGTVRPIGPGAGCTVTIDGETVITGWVDDVAPSYDAASHDLVVRGRDRTGDLVDCAVLPPYEFKALKLDEIVRRLAAPYGISVRADVDVGAPFARYALQPGETVFEAIERGCRQRAILPVSDGKGGILLTRAGTGAAAAPIVLGSNVIACQATFSYAQRFSEYHAIGQQEGADSQADASVAAAPAAVAKDAAVRRHRPTVVMAEAQGDGSTLQERAEWARAMAAAQSRRAAYIAQDWRPGGALWQPNTMVPVTDPWANLDGTPLLIVKTTMTLSDAGTLTQIDVAPKEAYALKAEQDAADKAKARAGSGAGGGSKDDPFSLWDAH